MKKKLPKKFLQILLIVSRLVISQTIVKNVFFTMSGALENFFLLSLADKERTSAVQYLFPAAGHKVARNKGRGPNI